MLWQDRVYLAAAGAGTVLSMVHYLATAKSVTGQVPLHFNFFGVPDCFAAPWALVLYPLAAVGFGLTAIATTLNPSVTALLPPNSVEQVASRVSLMCGYVAIVASQFYATRIADGSATKLPLTLLGGVYGGLGASLVAVLAAKYLSQP